MAGMGGKRSSVAACPASVLSRIPLLLALAISLVLAGGSKASAASFIVRVYFAHGSAQLDSGSRAVLRCAAEVMTGFSLYASAYADRSGPEDYNLELTRQRAMAVKAELVRLGFRPEHVTPQGFGETRLAIATPDGVMDQRNRYVWLHIDKYVGPQTNPGGPCRSPAYQEATETGFHTVHAKNSSAE